MKGKPSSFHSKAPRAETATRQMVRFAIADPAFVSKNHLWAWPTEWRAGQLRMSWQLASGSVGPLQTSEFVQDIFSDSPLVIRHARALKQASQHSRFSWFFFFFHWGFDFRICKFLNKNHSSFSRTVAILGAKTAKTTTNRMLNPAAWD